MQSLLVRHGNPLGSCAGAAAPNLAMQPKPIVRHRSTSQEKRSWRAGVQIERGVGQDLAANTCQADSTLPGRVRNTARSNSVAAQLANAGRRG
jgi:hypothetical protein